MNGKTLIIAEAGVNHNGSLEMAKQLIEVAAKAGADFVKFQTFSADLIVTKFAKKADYQIRPDASENLQYQMLRQLELSKEMLKELIAYSRKLEIKFLSTGFDIEDINLLIELGQRIFKVPSGEITNLPLLRYVGQLEAAVILSTGMSSLGEVEAALEILERSGTPRSKVTLLHCTSEYPAKLSEVNLRAMISMRDAFGISVGYSDHTKGIEVPIAAVALGASIIEKHFTLDPNLPGPDHQASLNPDELTAMILSIRNIEKALGDGIKRPTAGEVKNKFASRRSLVANCFIKIGDIFTTQNIAIKRPGMGISPMRLDEVMGKVARRDYLPDELIDL